MAQHCIPTTTIQRQWRHQTVNRLSASLSFSFLCAPILPISARRSSFRKTRHRLSCPFHTLGPPNTLCGKGVSRVTRTEMESPREVANAWLAQAMIDVSALQKTFLPHPPTRPKDTLTSPLCRRPTQVRCSPKKEAGFRRRQTLPGVNRAVEAVSIKRVRHSGSAST